MRKKIGILVVRLLLVISILSNYGIAVAAEIVKVPVGTPVTLRMLESVTSRTAQVGQRVKFVVEADTKLKGKVVVAKGAIAMGEVTVAGAAGMAGKAGSLTVTLQTVAAVDGSMIPISATKGAKGQSKLATSIAVTALCCIFAIFMKGKDVSFPVGSIYSAYVLSPVEVQLE